MGQIGSSLYRVKSTNLSRVTWMTSVAVGVTVLSLIGATLLLPSRDVAQVRAGLTEGSAPLAIPEPVAPAYAAADPRPIRPDLWDSVWGVVEKQVNVRVRPEFGARVIDRLSPVTPEGTDNIVVILDRQVARDSRLWVRVRFPSLHNAASGWVARSALGGYGVVHTRLVVDLGALSARLYRKGRLVFEAPVGVGKDEWPTPTGDFYVRNRLAGFGDPFYGPVAFGTSARSSVLTDWPAGGFVGIHGTSTPELIPGRVSHGCVMMRNADILRLERLMPVGTPLRIQP